MGLFWVSFESCGCREDINKRIEKNKKNFDDNYNLVYSDTNDNYKLHFANSVRFFDFTYHPNNTLSLVWKHLNQLCHAS